MKLNIKIYSDGADREAMLEMAANPLVSGLTTNPTLMKRAGISDFKSFSKDILQYIKDKPISFEVFSDEFIEMERQATEISSWGKNVYVKIPITNSNGESSIPLIDRLTHAGVKLNVTALMTLKQVVATAQILKKGAPSVISVFAGRVADTARDPMPMMTAAVQIVKVMDPNIEMLWASSREVLNIMQADQCGCHIITVTPDLIKKLKMHQMDLDQLSLDTVKMFRNDAEAAGYRL